MLARRGSLIAPTSVLGSLSDVLRAQLERETERVHIGAGEWLFREGEPADRAYLVRSGRLEVVVERPREVVIRQLKRGAMVGELALLSHGFRSASVRACRDSELTELCHSDFEHLMRTAPDFALGLVRVMAAQIAANRAPEAMSARPRTISVVGLDRAAPARAVCDELLAGLAPYGSVDELPYDPERAEAGFGVALERAESANKRVLLTGCSHGPGHPWNNFCLKEADTVVAVTTGVPDPAWQDGTGRMRGCELLAVGGSVAIDLMARLDPREAQVTRGQLGRKRATAQLARRLAGRSLGLVLSGGGARALAHLGVLDELAAADVVVDRLAGASMGAIISGLAATGASVAEVAETLQRNMIDSNPSNDYTFPAYSLVRGQKTRRALQQAFGDRRIEEQPKRWFCVSSDLNTRELVEHRTGLMVDAIYPSMAIPGIYPPMPAPAGRLLVDGGVLDNLPVEPMARRREGPIIAVDVSQRGGQLTQVRRRRWEPFARRLRLVMTGSEYALPQLSETMMRTIALGSRDTVAAAMQYADLVISPRVDGVGMLDWKQLPRSREIGRQAARAALEQVLSELEDWTSKALGA